MSKPCNFFVQNKNESQFFTINKPSIMKKFRYQQYFHCFIACILCPCTFWFRFQQNIVTILISAVFRSAMLIKDEVLIKGRCLLQCGYPDVRWLLEGSTYLRPGAYQRKYNYFFKMHFKTAISKIYLITPAKCISELSYQQYSN